MMQASTACRAILGILVLPMLCLAQIPHNQDEAPGPALSPADAMAKMTLPPGFSVKLFASEPEVVNPVAMTFDNRGRLWIVESLEYPRLEPGPGKDRIKILEDTDQDGRADKVTIFAEGLNIPSGIVLGYGGVYVANSPDLLFLRDTDGDDVADERKVLITGFGRDDVHELPSSLTWGPDGWLYGLNGVFNRSKIMHQGKKYEFTCALWRYHPKTDDFQIFCEGTSNPYGLDYDEEGSFFVSACVIDHLWHLTETGYYHRQAGAYPPYTWKISSIVSHKHQKAAYCGLCWYDADTFPAPYRGKLIMGNIHGSCLNVDAIERRGASYFAQPEPDFLSAHDSWFMPVSQKVGPDGCLWALDWYDRYHCYQDARRDPNGIDRGAGRIYRVVHDETKPSPSFDLGKSTDQELLAHLGNSNVFYRRKARQLLIEHNVEKAALEAKIFDQSLPLKTLMEALWTRTSQGDLSESFLVAILENSEPVIRAWGVRTAGDTAILSANAIANLLRLSTDADPRVRLQVAIAVTKQLPPQEAANVLLEMLARSGDDPSELLPKILWQNLEKTVPASLPSIARWIETRKADDGSSSEFFDRLFERLLDLPKSEQEQVTGLFATVLEKATSDTILRSSAFRSLFKAAEAGPVARELVVKIARDSGDHLSDSSSSDTTLTVARLGLQMMAGSPEAASKAIELLNDKKLPDPQRLQLFEAWTLRTGASPEESAAKIAMLIDALSPASLSGVWRIATRFDTPVVADTVLERFSSLPPEAQPQAIDLLVSRPMWRDKLLDAVESGRINKSEVGINHLRQMATSKREFLRARVEKIWGKIRLDDKAGRSQIVKRMRKALDETPGKVEAGTAVYARVCAQCHKLGKVGHEVGPELTRNGTTSLDNLTSNVFDPNLVVGDDYQPRQIITTDGRFVFGLIVEESDSRVILKIAGGERITVPRDEIDVMQESPQSIMPEGLEQQISEQDFRDLVAYLRQQMTLPQK